MLPHHEKLIFEYSQITPTLYIGTNQCCQTHFKKELLQKGIKADISLEAIKIDQPFGVKYYLWIPIKDHHAPGKEQLTIGTAFLKQLQERKIKTYIHCQHGHGRAPTLAAAYFISTGYSLQAALSLLKKKRPSIHINQKQLKALREFEEKRA